MSSTTKAVRPTTEPSESVFADFKEPYSAEQAAVEAHRCLFCSDAPCTKACPTHIDVPQFIRKIGTGNVKGAAKTIFAANIHGMSCARVCPVEVLCVGDCVFNELGLPPIQIGKLQRFATDLAFASQWKLFEAGRTSGKSVGIIGGGPAALAAAHELRRHGHAVTVYEKRSVLGGLNATGVAPYKMRTDAAAAEVAWIMSIGGIEVKLGVTVGKDVPWAELEKRHDALFLGFGLGADARLGVPGEDLMGIVGAVDFIERMKLGRVQLDKVTSAVVVGGGNTAIDATRELLGLGVANVTMLYRGTREGMSGYAHEWEAAVTAGATARWQALPLAFEGTDAVTSVRVARVGADKQPIAGTEVQLEAQLVLMAIGQAKLGELVSALPGIQLERGRIVVDEHGFTGRARVWAGGDCANGGKEVVNASAEGKRAALAIHAFFSGGQHA